MNRLKRWALPALAVLPLAIAGCGGSSHHAKPKPFTVEKVVQAHSTVSPIPQPGERMPAAVVPVPVPPKARAAAHVRKAPVVSHVAAKVPAHVAGARVHFAGDSSTATVEQFDSVTLSTVPSWAHYVAGYTNGNYQTYRAMLSRWPVVVGISVHQNHQDGGADCLDMEPGNPGPDAAGPWVAWQRSQGNTRPCLYSMLSWFPQIRASLAAYGIARSQVRLWDANWTYSRHVDNGYDCTQWTDKAFGLNLDESTCLLSFYGKPKPAPDPYAIYVKTRFLLPFGERASEYNTVKAWDRAKCQNPVRRPVCKSSHYHLQLLRDREWFVATHVLTARGWRTLRKPRWSYPKGQPLGSRFQLLTRRLNVGHAGSPPPRAGA